MRHWRRDESWRAQQADTVRCMEKSKKIENPFFFSLLNCPSKKKKKKRDHWSFSLIAPSALSSDQKNVNSLGWSFNDGTNERQQRKLRKKNREIQLELNYVCYYYVYYYYYDYYGGRVQWSYQKHLLLPAASTISNDALNESKPPSSSFFLPESLMVCLCGSGWILFPFKVKKEIASRRPSSGRLVSPSHFLPDVTYYLFLSLHPSIHHIGVESTVSLVIRSLLILSRIPHLILSVFPPYELAYKITKE